MRTPWSRAVQIHRLLRGGAVGGAFAIVFALAPGLHAQTSTAAAEATSRALVNSARSAAGLRALAEDSRLDAIARAQAQRMADRNAIFHNTNLGAQADAAGVDWQWIGENVGVGATAETIHEAFIASPEHHQNIVYPSYGVIGVGAAVGNDGSLFIVQDYAGLASSPPPAPKPLASTAPARSAAAGAGAASHPAASPVRTSAPSPAPIAVASVTVTHSDANAVVGGVVSEVVRF